MSVPIESFFLSSHSVGLLFTDVLVSLESHAEVSFGFLVAVPALQVRTSFMSLVLACDWDLYAEAPSRSESELVLPEMRCLLMTFPTLDIKYTTSNFTIVTDCWTLMMWTQSLFLLRISLV